MGLRWYVAYPLSSRHGEDLREEGGGELAHATIHRWVLKYRPLLKAVFPQRKRPVWGSGRMDETYIIVKGERRYLYRAATLAITSPYACASASKSRCWVCEFHFTKISNRRISLWRAY